MQQKHNWILLNKHESLPEQSGSKPIVVSATGQATFVHRPTREALQRISSINRLNDRIRRRLEESDIYASTSVFNNDQLLKSEKFNDELASEVSRRRANRIVDEHFDFIKREKSDIINNQISQDIYDQEKNFHESINGRIFRRQKRSLTDPFPEESSRAPERVHHVPIQMLRKRADSLDSGSVRIGVERDPNPTPMTPSDWHTPAVSQKPSFSHKRRESFQPVRSDRRQYRNRQYQGSRRPSISEFEKLPRRTSNRISRRPTRIIPRKTPSLLRRDSYFYKKCDICFNERRFDGIPCPACNSVFTKPSRRYSRNYDHQSRISRIPSKPIRMPPPPVTIEPYFEEEEEGLNDETSSTSSALPQADFTTPGRPWIQSATIPPRSSSQAGFPEYATSPRRQNILNPENLQRHPSYLAYMRGTVLYHHHTFLFVLILHLVLDNLQ